MPNSPAHALISPSRTTPGFHPSARLTGGINTNKRYWVKSGLRGDGLALTGEASNNATSPNIAAYNFTGDIEIVVRLTMGRWVSGLNMAIVSTMLTSTSGYEFAITTAGSLQFGVFTAGPTSVLASSGVVPFMDGQTYWLKVTRVTATGVITFQYAPDQPTEPTAWTTLNTATTTTGAMIAATQAMNVGSRPGTNSFMFLGGIMQVIVRNGIAGTVVYNANFAAQALGASSFVESSANAATVTINGSQTGLHDGRLMLNGSGAWGSSAYVTDNTAITVTGDIDLRALVAPTSWTPAAVQVFVARWGSGGNGIRAYAFEMTATTGILTLALCQDNTNTVTTTANSSVATGFAANAKKWVRATWRASDGRVQFFTCDGAIADPAPGDWVQLGTNVAAGTTVTALYPTTAILTFGDRNTTIGFTGSYYRGQVYNGIDGTCVVDANFSTAPSDVSWFRESSANALPVIVGGGAATTAAPGFGAWSPTLTNHWSTRSNGYPGSPVSIASNDVYFDQYSGPGMCSTSTTTNMRSLNFTDYAGVFTVGSGAATLIGDSAGGGLVLSSVMTLAVGSASSNLQFVSTSNNGGYGWPITMSGKTFGGPISYAGTGGGHWNLTDTNTVTGAVSHTGGRLNLNGQICNWNAGFASSGAIARTLVSGAATVNITASTSGWSVTGTNYQMFCDDITINMGTGILLNYSGLTTGAVTTGTNVVYGTIAWYGANMTASAGPSINGQSVGNALIKNMIVIGCNHSQGSPGFSWGVNYTTTSVVVTNAVFRGFNASNPMYMGTGNGATALVSTGATPLTVNITNAPTLSDIIFVDTTAGGGATPWTGTRLQDGGGNSNITFPASQTNYWVPTVGRMTGTGIYFGNLTTQQAYARTPLNAAYNANTTDLDIKVKANFDVHALVPIVARDYGGSLPWHLSITNGRVPGLRFNSTTYPSLVGLPYNAVCCRATWVKSSGLIYFYWSADPDPETAVWTQLGSVVAGPAVALITASAVGIVVGDYNSIAPVTHYPQEIQKVVVIQGGTIIFNADFAAQAAGTTSFSETSSIGATVSTVFPVSTGTGQWSDPYHWASTSGGTPGTGRMPYAQDDVRGDASSGTGTITIDRQYLGRDWNFTSSTITSLMHNGFGSGAVMWGSMILPSTTLFRIVSAASGQILYMKGRSATTIDTNGGFWGAYATSGSTFAGLTLQNLGQSVTFASDFYAPTTLLSYGSAGSVINGSSLVNTNKTVTIAGFIDNITTPTRTIDWGTTGNVWQLCNISGAVMTIPNQANLTLSGTPNFVIPETYDGVVENGVYRIPQPGQPPSGVLQTTGVTAGNNSWNMWPVGGGATHANFTGDLDIRFKIKRDFWTDAGNAVNIVAKQTISPGLEWIINCSVAGNITFTASLNGTTSPISVAPAGTGQSVIPNNTAGWIRFTRVASTGAYAWYYSLDATNNPTAVSWTAWGSGTATSGSLFNSISAPIYVGAGGGAATTVKGISYYYVGISNSVSSWTPVATLDFSTMQDYVISHKDPQGNMWQNIQSSQVATGSHRIHGGAHSTVSSLQGATYIAPDSAALSITGNIDVQVRVRPNTWTTVAYMVSKRFATGQASWTFGPGTGGNYLFLDMSADGTNFGTQVTSGVAVSSQTLITGQPYWVRFTWRQSDGRVQFFYAADSSSVPAVWTQLGTDKTMAIASIFDSTSPLEIGSVVAGQSPLLGDIYRVRVLNGILGTVAFDADFTTLQDDTFAFKESSVNQAVVRHSNGTLPAGNRTRTTFTVAGKTVPGTLTATSSGRILDMGSSGSPTYPATSVTGGKWMQVNNSQTYTFPSLTLVASATGPRSAYFSASDSTVGTTVSGGTINVQYADIYNSTASGASIPFKAVQGFDGGGNTNWFFSGLPYSTLPVMGV